MNTLKINKPLNDFNYHLKAFLFVYKYVTESEREIKENESIYHK